jgi:hypothetical protein
MKERPILFSTEMVKAILGGRKTMTRRVVKLHKPFDKSWKSIYQDGGGNWIAWDYDEPGLADFTRRAYPNGEGFLCPYGQVGDWLWVRETFCYKIDPVTAIVSEDEYWYRATNPEVLKVADDGSFAFRKDGWSASPWLPSIHMPRRASRITLEITNIRVERLQNISGDDALKEGLPGKGKFTARLQFVSLWTEINAKRGYSWGSNPWVWVVSFKVVK